MPSGWMFVCLFFLFYFNMLPGTSKQTNVMAIVKHIILKFKSTKKNYRKQSQENAIQKAKQAAQAE